MTNADLAPHKALTGNRPRVVPTLLSADLARTRAFYLGLGFTADDVDDVDDVDGDDVPTRQGFARHGGYLFFYTEAPHGTPTTPQLSGTIYFFTDSVDLLPYGLYEFGIVDPDGYHLAFAERRDRE